MVAPSCGGGGGGDKPCRGAAHVYSPASVPLTSAWGPLPALRAPANTNVNNVTVLFTYYEITDFLTDILFY